MTKNFLVTILTTNNLEMTKLSYESVINQKECMLKYNVIIVVNSKNDKYVEDVKEEFKDSNVEIISTSSNGKPGKGHNSVINLFFDRKEYDYLIPIDGDDFLYPYALNRINIYLEYFPDILILPYNDILLFNWPCNGALHIDINSKCYLCFNDYIKNIYNNWHTEKISPFVNNINKCNTPGRLLLLSRKGLNINIKYDENLKWYDDFIVFLQIFENSILNNKYKIFILKDTNIYLYNRLNKLSVTEEFKIDNLKKEIEEEKIFRQSIKNKYLAIREWNLKLIKVLEGDLDSNFNTIKKINFIKQIVEKLDLPVIDINKTYYDKFLKYAIQENKNDLKKLYNNNI